MTSVNTFNCNNDQNCVPKKNKSVFEELNDHLRQFYQNSALIFRDGAQKLLHDYKNEIFEWDHLSSINVEEFVNRLHSNRSNVFLRNVFLMILNGVENNTNKKNTITQSDIIRFLNGYKCAKHIPRLSPMDIFWLLNKMNEEKQIKVNDFNDKQKIDFKQFVEHLSSMALSANRIECLFKDIDSNMDGKITIAEYNAWRINLNADKLKLLLNSIKSSKYTEQNMTPNSSITEQLEIEFQGW